MLKGKEVTGEEQKETLANPYTKSNFLWVLSIYKSEYNVFKQILEISIYKWRMLKQH